MNMLGGSGPTFEDLSIDDSISDFERCIRYCRSRIGLQRLVHIQMISDVAEEVGFIKARDSLIPLLDDFLGDMESPIRQACAEQVAKLARFCKGTDCNGDEGYQLIITALLPVCQQLLEDDKAEVRQAASYCLVEITKLLKREDLGPHILTIVLALAHDDDKEEMRMTASELLNQLAEWLGEDLCKQFVIPEVVSLAEDPVFRVRKSTALNFQNICKVGGEHELFERLMPAYVRLSKDEMYRVRRACAESLADVSRHVSDDIRIGVLVEIFLRLAQDSSPLVKQSILHQSGVFIATLPRQAISEAILNQFCSMATGATGNVAVDSELKQQCAYTFPAVLQAAGRHRWLGVEDAEDGPVTRDSDITPQNSGHHPDVLLESGDESSSAAGSDYGSNLGSNMGSTHGNKERHDSMTTLGTVVAGGSMMKDAYMTLIASRNVGVKQTLALSLHRVAGILAGLEHDSSFDDNAGASSSKTSLGSPRAWVSGTKKPQRSVVEEELATVFEELIQDVEAVQIGIITHLAWFLELLTIPCRASYLPILPDILHSTNPFNWRLRQSLAQQLPELVHLPNPDALVAPLFPLVMALLQDPVAAVRKDSYLGTARMLRVLYDGQKSATDAASAETFSEEVDHVAGTLNRLFGVANFQQRQLWLELCVELLKELPKDLFERYFVDGIIELSSDPVVNVRVVVSELLTTWPRFLQEHGVPLSGSAVGASTVTQQPRQSESQAPITGTPWEWLLARDDIAKCVETLAEDDYDVYNNIIKLQPLFPSLTFKGKCMRGVKTSRRATDSSGESGEVSVKVDDATASADTAISSDPHTADGEQMSIATSSSGSNELEKTENTENSNQEQTADGGMNVEREGEGESESESADGDIVVTTQAKEDSVATQAKEDSVTDSTGDTGIEIATESEDVGVD